jgi:hypothetical protein
MRNSKITLFSLITTMLLVASTRVIADDDSGFYIGANINRASASFEDDRRIDFDDSDNAYGVKAGFMFTDFIGVELGYIDLGSFSTDDRGVVRDINLDADGFSAALVLNWSVIDQLDLYGKVGAFRVSANSNSFIGDQLIRADEDATEPFGAFGVEWDLGSFNLFGEVAAIDTDINELGVVVTSAGVKFEF